MVVILASIFGSVILLVGLAVWFDIAHEPARREAWVARCQEHGIAEPACRFLYAEMRRQDDNNALASAMTTMAIVNSQAALQRAYGR